LTTKSILLLIIIELLTDEILFTYRSLLIIVLVLSAKKLFEIDNPSNLSALPDMFKYERRRRIDRWTP
jgi:hypothetical protein